MPLTSFLGACSHVSTGARRDRLRLGKPIGSRERAPDVYQGAVHLVVHRARSAGGLPFRDTDTKGDQREFNVLSPKSTL